MWSTSNVKNTAAECWAVYNVVKVFDFDNDIRARVNAHSLVDNIPFINC